MPRFIESLEKLLHQRNILIEDGQVNFSRRQAMKIAGLATAAALVSPERLHAQETLPWVNGKYQTFPRQLFRLNDQFFQVLQDIDLGTLGPDVDTVAGIDFNGDIPTGALVIHTPDNGATPTETRVVFIKRTDLETVQLDTAISGDRFDIYQISKFGGDQALDSIARAHARNTARAHQKVVYIGDLGLFEKQYGPNELPLLNRMIRAQRPGISSLNIPDPDFVSPRIFSNDSVFTPTTDVLKPSVPPKLGAYGSY